MGNARDLLVTSTALALRLPAGSVERRKVMGLVDGKGAGGGGGVTSLKVANGLCMGTFMAGFCRLEVRKGRDLVRIWIISADSRRSHHPNH